MNSNNAKGRVVAEEPQPGDEFAQVVWFGPTQDGLHSKIFEGPIEPIERYDALVAAAKELAAQMSYSLYIVPMTGAQALRTERMNDAVANLTDQQRGELRQEVVATLINVMRDSNDPVVRADAHSILLDMKVIRS
jgi:hypothetical protein